MTYYRSLDGIRAAAVGIVVFAHAGVPGIRSGGAGVDVFFALSGFLITSILLTELDRDRSINFLNFYIRRFLRLLPCLWLTIAAVMLVGLTGRFGNVYLDALCAGTYSMNWDRALGWVGGGPLSHTWTLAIEEQYYLLWPLAISLLCRNRDRRLLQGACLVAAAIAVVAYRFAVVDVFTRDRIHYGLDTHADPLLIGSSLACFLSARQERALSPAVSRLFGYVLAPAAVAGIAAIVLCWAWGEGPPALTIGYPLVGLCTVAILVDCVCGRHSLLRPLLELPALVWVGRVSYGIYLWHLPIFTVMHVAGHDSWQKLLVVGGSLTLAVSALSFYLVEQRFLRLKRLFGHQRLHVSLRLPSWRTWKSRIEASAN